MPAASAGRPSPGAAELAVAQQGSQHSGELAVVNLPGQVLEEPVELIEVAVRAGQEGGGIDLAVLGAYALDLVYLHHQLVPEPLDASPGLDQLPSFEPGG